MLGLGLSLQKGVSAFNAGRALVSSYIRRVTSDGGVLQNTACDAAAINELNQDRLLEPASWVLIPDGIKEDVVYAQKPSTGLGDLTFTRASDATYTDASGVVRRSPYNLASWSEMFTDASWSKIAAGTGVAPSITANTSTSPTGTLTADRVQFNCTGTTFSDRSVLFQTITSAVIGRSYVFTIYIKANAPSEVGKQLRFNVDNGTNPAQVITINADWTRYTFAAIATSTSINALLETRGTVTTNTTADVLLWGAQLVEGTEALDYFPTTDRLNVPRIDFRNADGTLSSCGRLLLEPQRTNLMTYSEAFTNASWSKVATASGTITVTDNYNISPAGTSTASRLVINNLGAAYVAKAFTSVNATIYTMSIWAKSNTSSNYTFQLRDGYSGSVSGNLTVTPTLQRFTFTFTASGTTAELQFRTIVLGSYDLSIWGAQLEAGAYATSYIPTTTAAVTRLADTANKTGVSSIIGQSAGTIFWDVNDVTGTPANTGNPDFGIRNTAFTNWIGITTNSFSLPFRVVVRPTSGSIINYEANITRAKAAVAWSSAGAVLYVNGAQVGTSAVNPNFSFDIIQMLGGVISYKTNQSALFPTRLSNDQLEVLTSEGYGTYALLAQSLNCVLQ